MTTEALDPTVERIRALMARKGWTHNQVSSYLGVPASACNSWLQGKRAPNTSVGKLLDALGLVEALAPGIHAAFLPGDK